MTIIATFFCIENETQIPVSDNDSYKTNEFKILEINFEKQLFYSKNLR